MQNYQTLVAPLCNNIQQCKPTSVTSQFYASSGDKLVESIFNDDVVFLRNVITSILNVTLSKPEQLSTLYCFKISLLLIKIKMPK